MRRRGAHALAAILVGSLLTLAACGSDDPVPRSFDDEQPDASAEAPNLPAKVATQVKLTYKKKKFRVDVGAQRDYCLADREVTILEQGKKKDVKVGKLKTDEDGFGSLADKKAAGKFVAMVKKGPSATYGDVSLCLGSSSRPLKV
jgi:hypothetical protein